MIWLDSMKFSREQSRRGWSVQVENSSPGHGHFYVLSRLFVFWWDIAGLPNTQLIIPLIIHNVGDYSDKNIQFPQCAHPSSPLFLSLAPSPHLTYLDVNIRERETIEKFPPVSGRSTIRFFDSSSHSWTSNSVQLFVHKFWQMWFHQAWSYLQLTSFPPIFPPKSRSLIHCSYNRSLHADTRCESIFGNTILSGSLLSDSREWRALSARFTPGQRYTPINLLELVADEQGSRSKDRRSINVNRENDVIAI